MALNRAFFDNIVEKATDLAQSGVAKSKQLAEIAKLKTSNMAEEDTIKKAYIEIGKLYYAEMGQAPQGAYAAACEKITAARAAIEANNDRIAELKDSDEELAREVELVEKAAEAEAESEADAVTDADLADVAQEPEVKAQAPAEEAPAEDAPKAE